MIYDCFLFRDEFEMLDIRLHELSNIVDKFVLVESTLTHANTPKPLYFKQNKNLYKEFKDKIIHIVVEDSPRASLPWIINGYQFAKMSEGLKDCKPSDTILFGDLDEIPKADKVILWKDKPGKNKVFLQTLSYYYLNCVEYTNKPWPGTHMTTYKNLLQLGSTWIAKYSKPDVIIPNGGWHFSYIGGVKRIRKKLAEFAHQEYNNDQYNTPEKIIKAISTGEDFLNRGLKFKVNSVDFLPKYVLDNQEKFKDLIINHFASESFYYLFLSFFLDSKKNIRLIYRYLRRRFLISS